MPPRPPVRPASGPLPTARPSAPPPRPPVHSAYGPGGPHRGPAATPARRSRTAVVALVLAVLLAPVGLVLGIVARRRIAASSRSVFDDTAPDPLTGRGVATAAIVVGLVLTLAEAALVAALTIGVPDSWLSNDLPATSVQETIERTVPLPAGTVRCPGPLPATVGASIACTGTENGAPVGLRATVTVAQGRDVRFEITRG